MSVPPPKPGPPPPKPKGGGLDEVERALSILDGRHPEHTRIKREHDAAQAKKRAELEGDDLKAQKSKLTRGLVFGLLGGGLIAGAWSVYARHGQARAIDAALEPIAAPFVSEGFALVRTGNQRIDENVEPGCFVAVAPKPGAIVVEHGGELLKGEGSVGWCACNAERIAVTRGSASDLLSPLRLLRVDARAVGGLDGLGALDPRPETRSVRSEECLVEDFDGWLSDKHYPASHVATQTEDAQGDLSRLRAVGFLPVSGMIPGHDFAVVEPDTDSCRLAYSRTPGDLLSLRTTGGDRPLKGIKGPIAWCDSGAHPYTVWREGKGEVLVLSAPSARMGGLFGLGEKIARARLAAATTWLAPEDIPWDAVETLRGSGVPDATVTLGGAITDPRSIPEGRLVALSAQGGGAFAEPHGDVVCDSKPGVCAQLAPQAWRQRGTAGAVGVAQAPLPFWLSVLGPAKEPEVLRSMVALLALARRLRGEGFEPTTLEGVKESEGGVEVIGRGGDDAVVAVGLGPKAPFVFPFSDGVPWKLGNDPRIVELKPGERALLSAEQQPTAPKEARRTVVFRRSASR